MRRILIVGSTSSGKSTLPRSLAERLDLPSVHLDAIFWSRGWVMRAERDFQDRLATELARDAWIIDGCYLSTRDQRLRRADTLIYLDFPTRICLWRVLKRIFTSHGKARQDVADGCPERFDFEFLALRPRVQQAAATRDRCGVGGLSRCRSDPIAYPGRIGGMAC